jgi:putative ABC transport system permease protein
MLNDLRFAFRQLIKSPGFSVIAILTLALGIGANSAIFSVVNAVLLRPLPFSGPNELTMVWNKTTQQGESAVSLSYPDAVDIRERSKSIAHAAVISRSETVLEAADQSQLLQGLAASSEIFPTLDLVPFRGTAYGPERDQPDANAARVVLISHALWQSAFGADPKIVGRQIRLASRSFRLIGFFLCRTAAPIMSCRSVPRSPRTRRTAAAAPSP